MTVGAKTGPNAGRLIPFTKSNNATGYKVGVGYQFGRFVGVEAFYADLGTQHVDFTNGRTNDMSIKGYGAVLTGKVPLPVERLSLTGRVGAFAASNRSVENGAAIDGANSQNHYDNTDKKVQATYGLGLAYKVSTSISVLADWDHFDAKAGEHTVDMKANLYSLGLQYKF